MGLFDKAIERTLRRMANEGSISITTSEIVRDPGPPIVECAACEGKGRVPTQVMGIGDMPLSELDHEDFNRLLKSVQGICLGCDGAGRKVLR